MPRQFKTARLINNLKATEAAEKLGVSQPTLSAWEGERKSPSVEGLEKMADFYGVSTDYLLGRTEHNSCSSEPIPAQVLPIYHNKPVWSAEYGWMLVNAIDKVLFLPDGQTLPFSDGKELFSMPVPFSETQIPNIQPLRLSELRVLDQIWVEPISPDSDLRKELRGWYRIKKLFAENEYGNRFYLDTYGAKWLAFTSNLSD